MMNSPDRPRSRGPDRDAASPDRLEALIARDLGERGITGMTAALRGELHAAASALHACLREPVGSSRVVAIATGFTIPDSDPPAGETDGPLGAAAIARAIRALGHRVLWLGDEHHAPHFEALGEGEDLRLFAPGAGVEELLAAAVEASALIAIERPGPGSDGVPRSMRGLDLRPWTAPLHLLFEQAGERLTIGIGDGGNELGMGRLPADVLAARGPGACVTATRHTIACGVSNWGGLALAARLIELAGGPEREARLADILDARRDEDRLRALVAAGAVDGVLGRPAHSVDGLDWREHARLIDEMRALFQLSPTTDSR